MPITLLLVYGSMGGLASVLVSALLGPLLPADAAPGSNASAKLSLREALTAGVHLLAGAGVAALYWFSWGFAAIVSVPWWARGLIFGGACFTAMALPVLLAMALHTRMRASAAIMLALEWLCTCILAALACAWSWAT